MKAKTILITFCVVAVFLLIALPAGAQAAPQGIVESAVTTAFYLALINKTLVDYLADPFKKKYPAADMWWLMYVSLATGAVLAWVSGVNIFGPDIMPNVLVARILTSIVVGGGGKLLYD